VKLIKLIFIIVFALVFIGFCAPKSINWIQTDPVSAINEFLPGSVKLINENGADAIEFCPDNTCDLFVDMKQVGRETLSDFTFIFLYFFSDFSVLNELRKFPELAESAERILSKPKYNLSKEEKTKDKARRLLKCLAKGDKIMLYYVCYDEGFRAKEKMELNELLKTIPE